MSTFAVVAHRCSPTSSRLGPVITPAQALTRLGEGDVALGRLDVLASLDGPSRDCGHSTGSRPAAWRS
jgi:hypothetical protein